MTHDAADLQDARAIRMVFAAIAMSSKPNSGDANAARRWCVNSLWMSPRRKYLWDNAPRSAAALANPDSPLVREHLVPSVVLSKLLATGPQTDEAYLDTLRRYFVIVIVTKEEDAELTRLGHRKSTPNLDDIWARYRAAGIAVVGAP